MIKKLTFVCSLAAAFLLFTSAKPEKSIGTFDSAIQDYFDEAECVGMSVSLFSGNKIIFSKAYGVKDLETEEPMQTSNVYKVGLSGRCLASIAIYQLVDAGMISTKDDISKWLGFEVRNPNYPDIPITVNMVLKQTSSLKENKDLKSISDLKEGSYVYENIWGKYKPGAYTKFLTGATILAAIVEKASGDRFDDYVKKYIFEPLKINAGYLNSDFQDGERVSSYLIKNGSQIKTNKYIYKAAKVNENYVLGESTFALGVNRNLMISSEDMSKILLTMINGGVCPMYKTRILSEKSVDLLLKPNKSNKRSAFSSIVSKDREGVLFYNANGNWNGTLDFWAFDPESKLGCVVFCNGIRNAEKYKDFAKEARSIFVNTFYAE